MSQAQEVRKSMDALRATVSKVVVQAGRDGSRRAKQWANNEDGIVYNVKKGIIFELGTLKKMAAKYARVAANKLDN